MTAPCLSGEPWEPRVGNGSLSLDLNPHSGDWCRWRFPGRRVKPEKGQSRTRFEAFWIQRLYSDVVWEAENCAYFRSCLCAALLTLKVWPRSGRKSIFQPTGLKITQCIITIRHCLHLSPTTSQPQTKQLFLAEGCGFSLSSFYWNFVLSVQREEDMCRSDGTFFWC